MLEYLFGDTPQVRIIEYLVESSKDYPRNEPTREEIRKNTNIPSEEFNKIYDEFIDMGFITNEDGEHYISNFKHEYCLDFIIQETKHLYYNKLESSKNKNKFLNSNELELLKKHAEFNEFLKRHYKFPSDNIDEINEFIRDDTELEKIIKDLPEIISKEFQDCSIILNFTRYTNITEKILEIAIDDEFESKSKSEFEIILQKEDKISDYVIDNYNSTDNEFFIDLNL